MSKQSSNTNNTSSDHTDIGTGSDEYRPDGFIKAQMTVSMRPYPPNNLAQLVGPRGHDNGGPVDVTQAYVWRDGADKPEAIATLPVVPSSTSVVIRFPAPPAVVKEFQPTAPAAEPEKKVATVTVVTTEVSAPVPAVEPRQPITRIGSWKSRGTPAEMDDPA